MMTWKLKGCPRCRGDVFVTEDMNGWYEQCLQCSHRRELKDLAEYNKTPVTPGGARGMR